ncbi:transcriptional regulator [Amycolatopsis sp. CA-230715]|uniref:transcriptional regulator n=1 Tax=Amycolatopsis sp. CA-230715 TaxID=2745196 RepID=UPI001C03A0E4|nr:transcriptional regulator [Amycolatopsis sp. CA-230715]QWF78623.1 hypothetical protein HUW46_02021 [Amycolatopsis sp. CA-230715]
MTRSAREVLDTVRQELLPSEGDNRLVPLIEQGRAPRSVFAALAAEEYRIVTSDWRSFLALASRADERNAREFFAGLAQGEGIALGKLTALAGAMDLDDAALRAHRPRAGCQAYPAYVAWLALNVSPADAVVAMVSNFAAWGSYCATIAQAMRTRYDFDDEACGFFDLFGTPLPDDQAVAAVQAGIDSGALSDDVSEYGRLFQSYELMFWNTIADEA